MLDRDSRTELTTVNYLDSCTRKASKINASLIHDHAIDRQFVILKHLAGIVSFAKPKTRRTHRGIVTVGEGGAFPTSCCSLSLFHSRLTFMRRKGAYIITLEILLST